MHTVVLNCSTLNFFFADMTVKTVSEEYTPLHLAARLKPATCYGTANERVEPDSSGPDTSIIDYLKQCKDVNVSRSYKNVAIAKTQT